MEESAEYSAEYGAPGDSAEYSAEYGTPGYSAEYSAEYGTPGYSAEYSAQYPARGGFGGGYPAPSGGYDPRTGYPAPAGGGQGMSSNWTEPPQGGFPRGRAPAATTGRKGRGGRKRFGGLVAAVIVLALVVVAAGAGYLERGKILARLRPAATAPAFATYTPGPTPTVLPKFKQYASKNAAYVLNYPDTWTLSSINTPSGGLPDYADTFEQGNPPAAFAVERAQIFDPLSDHDAIQSELRAAEKQGFSFTRAGTTTTVSAGGEHWTREEYDALYKGNKLHYAFLATHHLGHSYVIALAALPDDFAKEDSGSFANILATFRFL